MRLLQVSLRSLLLYALILVIISIPVSFYVIREIIQGEVDASLKVDREEFVQHLKNFEYLTDLEVDLQVLDQLTHDVKITPGTKTGPSEYFQTVYSFSNLTNEEEPFRELTSKIVVKGNPYVLSLRRSLGASEKLSWAIVQVQAALIVLLVGGLIFINKSLSQRLWKPFYNTLAKLKAYEVDKVPSFEYESTNIAEFDDLNTAIQQLTSKNTLLFQQQKEFIENASHELQTPIAVFQSKLDILMQQPGLTETQARLISELESTAQRMARLNRNIVLLSKIDNRQFSDIAPVSLDVLIENQIDQMAPLMSIRGLTIDYNLEPTVINANHALLEILVQNLLTNAKRHNVKGGRIDVVLKNKELIISNPGSPLQNPSRIFDRFSKESNFSQSLGLGLAIVKRICAVSKYDIHYGYEEGFHKFLIKF
jgi:signal transduction histidine kinase